MWLRNLWLLLNYQEEQHNSGMKSNGTYQLSISHYFMLKLCVGEFPVSDIFQHSLPHSCQEVLLNNMTLGPNIARNAALRENVFMMVICIELRIPLFLVGKPGSSKSLAKSIVQASMQGTASSSELLRRFKQVSKKRASFIVILVICWTSNTS